MQKLAVFLMNELKQSKLICNEIFKTEKLFDDMKKYIIIKINYDTDNGEKSYELANDYVLDFDFETF